jgi:GT2 family glycosyltransferase
LGRFIRLRDSTGRSPNYTKHSAVPQYNINLAVITVALQLSIIIVNYNVKYFLEQCLCSLVKAIGKIESEVFVVDNNSTDGSREFFTGKFPQVKFIWNEENIGFARANNLGVKQATGNYILFLNPDTLLPEDCLEKCISFFESNPGAGALGIKMLDGSGKFLKESKRSFPSPVTSFYKLFGLTKLFPHSPVFSKYYLGDLDENQQHEVDVLAGAFMMVPKKIIDSVGSFDEEFFMYGEDIDLSFRIKEAGYKNFYFAGSSIIHFKGESTKRGGLNYVRLFYKAMSIFARKHYGNRAMLFNFFIQLGILVRAIMSAVKRFIQWIGMPVIDGALILTSFWIVKLLWSHYIKKEVNYSPNMLIIGFPVFTLIFLITSYYSGLYDNGFKQRRLNHSTVIAFVVLLSIYSLLPESLRFSRGILVFGSLLAFLIMTITRWCFVQWRIIESDKNDGTNRQTFVIGTEIEFEQVRTIMQNAGMKEKVLGRIDVNGSGGSALGNVRELRKLVTAYPIEEIIFCEGQLSFKQIIETIKNIPNRIRIKFHAAGGSGIVGSDNNKTAGGFISTDKQIKLSMPVSRRNKHLVDILISLFFIATFPVHFFMQKKPGTFFKNVFDVLLLRKTWIGYSIPAKALPKIKEGILTTTGLPLSINTLPAASLAASDNWYAQDYTVWEDIKTVWRNYRFLGT